MFGGRPRTAFGRDEVVVTLEEPLLRGGGFELFRHHAHRNAGLAIETTGPIGDRLAAAETYSTKRFIQLVGILAAQFGEDLALAFARQIGTRGWAPSRKTAESEPVPSRC